MTKSAKWTTRRSRSACHALTPESIVATPTFRPVTPRCSVIHRGPAAVAVRSSVPRTARSRLMPTTSGRRASSSSAASGTIATWPPSHEKYWPATPLTDAINDVAGWPSAVLMMMRDRAIPTAADRARRARARSSLASTRVASEVDSSRADARALPTPRVSSTQTSARARRVMKRGSGNFGDAARPLPCLAARISVPIKPLNTKLLAMSRRA